MEGGIRKSVLVAMSGGVDSSVAAWLLKECGYRVGGATMRLYYNEQVGESSDRPCCSQRDIADAGEVAFELGIPYEVFEFQEEFCHEVIDRFVAEYESGRTPNPCVDCNRYMKFGAFLDRARERGYDCVATGHYARVEFDERSGRWLLKKAKDATKDQSYVLYMLKQPQLEHILMPLGDMTKSEVRALAERRGFRSAHKRESQDICFVPDGDYGAFLERYTGKNYPNGDFVDESGNKIGEHRGAVRYTLGQRRGLRLAAGERVYVLGKDMERNTVTVGAESALYSRVVYADGMNWISIPDLAAPMAVEAKTRYRAPARSAIALPESGGRVRLEFDEPQRAVTPGQSVVLYDGENVVGGGTITATER